MKRQMINYTDEDIKKIILMGINCELDTNTIEIIKLLSAQVGSPEYIRTPKFLNNNVANKIVQKNPSKNPYNKYQEYNLSKFNSMTQHKKKTINTSLDLIRKHINKISEKTYENLKNKIFDEIKIIIGEEEINSEVLAELDKVGNAIFDIASSNGFYSEMYARLYYELMKNYSFMKDIFTKNYNEFNELFNDIKYTGPNENYDKFCEMNKINDKRRSVSLFYINLMKKDVVSKDSIIDIILCTQNKIITLIDEEDKKEVIEELSELIFILVSNSTHFLEDHPEWNKITYNVEKVSKMKIKSRPSISNKTIFKHMDLIDELEKN